jgi:hypothetical protein
MLFVVLVTRIFRDAKPAEAAIAMRSAEAWKPAEVRSKDSFTGVNLVKMTLVIKAYRRVPGKSVSN